MLTLTSKKLIGTFVLLSGLAVSTSANIVCRGQSNYGPAQVEIAENEVTVSGGFLSQPRVFRNLTKVNGLTTAPGLAITMQDHFGCLRNTVIITEFREPINAGYMEVLEVSLCSGGSTPDSLCSGQSL